MTSEARHLQQNAHAPGTRANRSSNLQTYLTAADSLDFDPLRPSEQDILNFLALLARSPRGYTNITAHLASIDYYCQSHGSTFPLRGSFRVRNMLRALKRSVKPPRRYKIPISPRQLRAMLRYFARWSFAPMLCFAVSLTLLAMLRQSNIAPPSRYKFSELHQLCFGDVLVNRKGTHLLVRLKWSKTRQNDEMSIIRIPRLDNSPFCPVRLFEQYKQSLGFTPGKTAPLLMIRDNHDRLQVVSTAFLTKYLKTAAAAIDLPVKDISLHSLRRTGAIIARANGVDVSDIKHMGTWSSDAIHCYLSACAHMFIPTQQAWKNV